MQPLFTIGEAVSYGWKKTWEHVGFLAILTLVFFVISTVIGGAIGDNIDSLSEALLQIVSIFVSYFAMFTFVRIGLSIYRGEKPQAKDVFEIDWKLFGIYILSALLLMLVTTVGFILLIIPGIILTIRLGLSGFTLIDSKLGPVQALKKSFEMTRGRFWHLLGFSIVLGLINIAGLLALGIGLLVTAPLCLLATVYVYEKLKTAPLPAAPIATVPTVTP